VYEIGIIVLPASAQRRAPWNKYNLPAFPDALGRSSARLFFYSTQFNNVSDSVASPWRPVRFYYIGHFTIRATSST
jgi:hypothetical protein